MEDIYTMSIAIVSGYFDPLHAGHLELIDNANKYGAVYVIVNSNSQALLKKGEYFMDELERFKIICSLYMIKEATISIDTDKTVCRTIEQIRILNPEEEIVFVNGDEYNKKNCAEAKTCKRLGIKCKYEGKKIQSSSWLTKK